MNIIKVALISLLIGWCCVACKVEQGPAEKAGEKVDRAIEDAGDAVEDAGDEVEEAVD